MVTFNHYLLHVIMKYCTCVWFTEDKRSSFTLLDIVLLAVSE